MEALRREERERDLVRISLVWCESSGLCTAKEGIGPGFFFAR